MLWPDLQRQERVPRIFISHDVDFPFCGKGIPLATLVRQSFGDLIKRKSVSLAWHRSRSWLQTRSGNIENDLCNTFDFIMDVAEENGLQSDFYFIPKHSAGEIDGYYSLDDPEIRQLIRRIKDRGHNLGYHASYNSFLDSNTMIDEFDSLLRVFKELGVDQGSYGGRQHFLRWQNPITWQNWTDAGLEFDSTLGFSEYIGFRSGTCYEHTVFNLIAGEQLPLKERPLTVMDVTLFAGYGQMNLSWEEVVSRSVDLYKTCKMFDGDFSLLWHNNHLITLEQRKCFRSIVELISGQ